MFFARTLSWLGFFPRFTSVTCFRTFLHLCSCSTFSPARYLAESTLFPQSRRCDWPHFVIILEVFILWRTNSSSLDTSGIMDSTWYGEGEHFVRHAFWCGEIQCSDWRLRSGGGMKKSALLVTLYRTASVKAYGLIGLLTAVQRKIFTEKLRRVLKSWGCQFHCFNYQLTVN